MAEREQTQKIWYSRQIARNKKRRRKELRELGKAAAGLIRHPDAPRTRAECKDGPRPCPFVACRHNLFLDVTKTGSIRFPKGDTIDALSNLESSCALDIAESGPKNYHEIAKLFDRTRTQIRNDIFKASDNLADYLRREERGDIGASSSSSD